MPELYTQDNRPIRVDTDLGKDVLLLHGFNGLEGVSQPFAFQLDLMSTNPDIHYTSLLRTPVLVSLNLPGGDKRYFHGICSRFSHGRKRDDLTFYRAEIVPWLWFLRLSRESRIYQDMTVPDVLTAVFDRLGYADYRMSLTRSYLPLKYCVQYRETHFDFVSRLMEEEGIFYFFQHSEEKHELVLTDDSSLSETALRAESAWFALDEASEDQTITEWDHEYALRPGKVTLSDYDFEQPTLDLERSQGFDEAEELYDYPGRYNTPDEGERLALVWLQAEEARRETVSASSNVRGLTPGYYFNLREHYRRNANVKYYVVQVQHFASAGEFRAWDANADLDYHNNFTCIPQEVPYRTQRRTPRPLIHGSQSALVVGPAGEEVYTDEYGRVKVQFYWDRDGKRDENSSCWIRVTTPWGGKGYGSISIPRIGNEVMVAFEEGDPDRPIIIGSVYNAEQTPPFELPGAGIQMGMHSRSSPDGGGNNEITMTDTKGKEMMNLNAQFDQMTTVGNDQTNTINNNRVTSVAVDDTEDIGANQTITVGADQSTTVGGDQTTTVSGNQATDVSGNRDVTVSGNQTTAISGDESLSVSGTRTAGVDGNEDIVVGGNQTISVSGNGNLSVSGKYEVGVDGDLKIDGAVNVTVKGGAKITLEAAGSKIEIGPSGITIQSGAIVSIMGATVKLN
jgi:type VI secretion system secreted protein VgrG